LIDAADRLFHQRGYHLTTVEEIAAEAGASRATFYLHFAGKAAVAVAVFATLASEVTEFTQRLDTFDRPSRAEVRDWLIDTIAWWEEHRTRVEAYEQVLAAEPEVARRSFESRQQLIDQMHRYLARWDGEERERARVRIAILIMQLDRVCYFWIVRDCPIDREHLLEALTEQWWTALNAEPTQRTQST
jgi:AcrR family transcriptional regulator